MFFPFQKAMNNVNVLLIFCLKSGKLRIFEFMNNQIYRARTNFFFYGKENAV